MLKPIFCLLSFWHGLGPPIDLLRLRVCVRVYVRMCLNMMMSKICGIDFR